MKRYRLKLKRLDFISAVDAGAQGTVSDVALIKRADEGGFEATCRVTKLDEHLGLVFGWALAGTLDGGQSEHVDLQGDAVDVNSTEFIKVAADFMEAAGASDVMHDNEADGRIVFAMPLVPEVNAALGIKSDVHGLAIAMKPSEATFKRFLSGELAAFSIAGVGERIPLEKVSPTRTITVAPSAHQKSTRLTQTKESAAMTLDEALAEIEDLKAKLAAKSEEKDDAEKRASLTDGQRAHLKALDKADAKAFLAKSSADRNLEIAKALEANPIEFTCADGTEIRKSHGPLMLKLAKQADEALKAAQVEKAAREETELRKRAADTIGALAGTDEVHMALLKAAEGIADEKVRTDAIATLKAANMAMATKSVAAGANDGTEPSHKAPQGELDALVAKHMAEHKVDKTAATAAVLSTPDGARLYGAIVKALRK